MIKFTEFLLLEVAPPGLEDWVIKHKPDFKSKGTLYAIAWKLYNEKVAKLSPKELEELENLKEKLKTAKDKTSIEKRITHLLMSTDHDNS